MGVTLYQQKTKSFGKFYLMSVLHRFIRIWPTYMLAILMFWKVGPYLGSGPIWRTFYNLSCSCNNGGVLWNVFFIDNFGLGEGREKTREWVHRVMAYDR